MIETVRWITAHGDVLDGVVPGADLLPGKLRLIDQTVLPEELVFLELDDTEAIFDAILRLSVRGAPAIGCAAALGLAAVGQHVMVTEPDAFRAAIQSVADRLNASRPTAVNLSWALARSMRALEQGIDQGMDVTPLKHLLVEEGLRILAEDIRMCRAIGETGHTLVPENGTVLTHCNAGALATGDFGTALSPLYVAHERGRNFSVYADETRPLLQGARLTAWELHKAGIDVTVICDSMAGALMREGKIDLVITGTDRIAANGDVANKIGTYGVAVLAKHHGIPFYVAAPYSTIDLEVPTGAEIPIEDRDPNEIRCWGRHRTVSADIKVYNPAFDVTPHALVSGFITDRGLIRAPYASQLEALVRSAGE